MITDRIVFVAVAVSDNIHSVLLVEITALRLRALPERLNVLLLTPPSDGAELCSDDVLRDKSTAMSRMLRAAGHRNYHTTPTNMQYIHTYNIQLAA